MINTGYFFHPDCLRHEMGRGHVEQPDRARAIHAALLNGGLLERMRQWQPEPAGMTKIRRVHAAAYLDSLIAARPPPGEYRQIDPDTAMNSQSWPAALLAAGAAVLAVDRIMTGEIGRAFCNVRPPGHHAERARCMGFCFVNNIAVAAAHALEHHGLRKVAIVDFDVHHGNGTEDIFRDDPRVLLCSLFQSPLYPYQGEHTVSPHIVNIPLLAGTDGPAYRAAFSARVAPRLTRFAPELLLFSAGFDAHRADPLAALELVEADYYWLTRAALEATRESARGRAVSLLEGGYDLEALAASACRHVEALLED